MSIQAAQVAKLTCDHNVGTEDPRCDSILLAPTTIIDDARRWASERGWSCTADGVDRCPKHAGTS